MDKLNPEWWVSLRCTHPTWLEANDESHEPWWKGSVRDMNHSINDVKGAIAQFIKSCGRDYEFPAGCKINLLTQPEETLYAALRSEGLSDAERIVALSEGLEWRDCYSIVVFGLRLAILAVRNSTLENYKYGILALAAGIPKVDWRDLLVAFAIFENCGNRLGIRFQDEWKHVVEFANEAKACSIAEDFFSRADDMRLVEVLGFFESGSGCEFTFKPI